MNFIKTAIFVIVIEIYFDYMYTLYLTKYTVTQFKVDCQVWDNCLIEYIIHIVPWRDLFAQVRV